MDNRYLEVFVRAKTSDGRWVSVNAADLDERSFRLLILHKLAESNVFTALVREGTLELSTPLTKQQVEEQE